MRTKKEIKERNNALKLVRELIKNYEKAFDRKYEVRWCQCMECENGFVEVYDGKEDRVSNSMEFFAAVANAIPFINMYAEVDDDSVYVVFH